MTHLYGWGAIGGSARVNVFGMFGMNQLQMMQSSVESLRPGGKLRMPSGPWLMLGVC